MGETVKAGEVGSAILQRRGAVGRGFGLAVDLALVILCGLLLARLFWIVMAPTSTVDMPVTSDASAQQKTPTSFSADPRVLQEFDPFNRNVEVVEVVEEDAPETTLNLSIKSIIAVSNPEESSVRIKTPDGSEDRYQEGDSVVAGVTVDRILDDRVILIRNGQREALYVREKSVLGEVDNRPSPAPSQSSGAVDYSSTARLEAAVSGRTPQGSEAPGGSDLVLSKSITLSSVDEFNERLNLTRVAGDDGQPQLIIQSVSDPQMMKEFAVAEGDVLISVNGMRFDEESLAEIYESMRRENVLNFALERDGQSFTRRVTIGNSVGD